MKEGYKLVPKNFSLHRNTLWHRKLYFSNKDYKAYITLELHKDEQNRTVFTAIGDLRRKRNGLIISRGQCIDKIAEYIPEKNKKRICNTNRICELWERWHANNTRIGCIHQREFEKEPYENHRGHHCDICDHTYGTKYIYEEIPAEIIEEIKNY